MRDPEKLFSASSKKLTISENFQKIITNQMFDRKNYQLFDSYVKSHAMTCSLVMLDDQR